MSEKIKNVRLALVALLLCFSAAMQAQTVKGNVKDALGEAVIGATVMEKGTTNGTITDFDGNFTLKMKSTSHDLQISYVGMKPANVKVGSKTEVNVTLEDDATTLNEVVAIGYGSKARKDLTGSVGSISGAKLAAIPVSSAADALVGKIAGVQVTSVDGQPGAEKQIRVRGASSVTQSNDPLYIIDGFQSSQTAFNDLPPEDIASIDVLKDASLTAIYGAKGSNGVIVVTTKSAQAGKIQVSFNGRISVSHLSRSLDLMNTGDFAEYTWDRAAAGLTYSASEREKWRYNFGNPMDLPLYYRQPTNDWQDEVLGNTPMSYNANVSVGGGNETTKFKLTATQSEEKGIILGSGVRRTNINFKLNTNIHKNLTLIYNPRLSYRRQEGAGGNSVGSGGIIDVLRYRPTAGLRGWGSYSDMENVADAQAFALTNPVSDIATNTQKRHSYNFVNQLSLKWTPIKGLILKTEFNYNMTFSDSERFYGWKTSEAAKVVNQNRPVAVISNTKNQSYTWVNTAAYDMELKDVHNLSFLLGQEIYHSQSKLNQQAAHLFDTSVTSAQALNNMALGIPYANDTYTKLSTANRTASFFAQASYNYDHKYFIAATVRADGSTKFAPGNQWGVFPSVSGAWDAKQEKFLKDVKWLDQAKLRVSFGTDGNNGINDDLWRFLYAVNSTGGPTFGTPVQGGELYYTTPGSFPNKDIKWETSTKMNLALDLSFFGGRLSISPEFYINTTRDMLYNSTIPSVSGYTKQMQNIGKVENKGIELTVNGDILRGKDYVLSANFTLGNNVTTIKELNATDTYLFEKSSQWKSSDEEDYFLEVGGQLGQMYGYVYDGLYGFDEFTYPETNKFGATPKTQAILNGVLIGGTVADGVEGSSDAVLTASNSGVSTMPGKIKLKDLNNDGKIDKNDKTIIGNTNPTIQGGFGFSGKWKNLDAAINFQYMIGFDVYNANAYALSSSVKDKDVFYNVLGKFAGDRWRYTDNAGLLSAAHESIYKNTYNDNTVEMYRNYNAGVKYWNPADLINNQMISYFVEDASFVRCTDLTIGYTLPKKWVKALSLSKVRAYAAVSNLFVITGYSGYDPEVDIQSGLTPSMDYNRYPRSRTFSFGVNVDF